ncbi:MAG: monovalent cation/H(+) antiporter subunit G [Granulosicoccus sp.]
MSHFLIVFLLLGGGIFAAIAGIGLLRFPDVLMRMHASTKAGTLGVGLSVISVAIFFADDIVTTRVILTVSFILLTAPVAAHLIGRAAYRTASPLWSPTIIEDDSARQDSDRVTPYE